MAVDIQRELESQLQAVNDKLASMSELVAQKARLEATLKLLTGEITLEQVMKPMAKKAAKAADDKPHREMSELHKSKIQLAHLRKKLEVEPKNAELKRKVGDLEALIKSLDK